MTHAFPDLRFVQPLVDAALAEDVGSGDVTTLSTVAASAQARAEIVAKEEGVVCGLPVARAVFARVEPDLAFEPDAADGDPVTPGQVVARLHGPARGILTGERVALNFVQHLSGIASATARAARALEGTPTRILDTRKTIPGLRLLAKYAVRCGGGGNHRQGLYDMILIKENHIAAAGGITAAIERGRERYPDLPLEVEVTNDDELREALAARPDRVMLDNFTPDHVARAMTLLNGWEREHGVPRPEVELSGGIHSGNLSDYARAGADFISSGAVTHSAPALDFSLEITDRL